MNYYYTNNCILSILYFYLCEYSNILLMAVLGESEEDTID